MTKPLCGYLQEIWGETWPPEIQLGGNAVSSPVVYVQSPSHKQIW